MTLLLAIVALVLFVYGVVRLIHGDIALGIILLVLACLVGPGGYSLFQR